jgi:hypothetical protein
VTAVDSNILIAAHRAEHALHETASRRLKALAEGDTPWGLPVFCIVEFLRVVTHPRVFTPPSSLETGCQFIDALLESPTLRLVAPGDRFWPVLRDAASQAAATGNLLFDAQIAAVCKEKGISRLLTSDRDFGRFPFLAIDIP